MGNHELMMLEYLDIVEKYNLKPSEIDEIYQLGTLKRRLDKLRKIKDDKNLDREKRENAFSDGKAIIESDIWKHLLSKYARSDRNLFESGEVDKIANWLLTLNGGLQTREAYDKLPEDIQIQIKEFLRQAYIEYSQIVEGQNKLYVHSRPIPDIETTKKLKGKNDAGIRYSELSKRDIEFSVWNRETDTFTPCKQEGFTTICGHDPTPNTTVINNKQGFICLDEGCGHGQRNTTGLYCIENGTVIHINQMGEIEKENGKIEVIDELGERKIVQDKEER